MKFVFRPFGVGFEDVDTKEIAASAKKLWNKAVVVTQAGVAKSKPHVLNAAEVALRYTANGLCVVSNVVADAHDAISKKQVQ